RGGAGAGIGAGAGRGAHGEVKVALLRRRRGARHARAEGDGEAEPQRPARSGEPVGVVLEGGRCVQRHAFNGTGSTYSVAGAAARPFCSCPERPTTRAGPGTCRMTPRVSTTRRAWARTSP